MLSTLAAAKSSYDFPKYRYYQRKWRNSRLITDQNELANKCPVSVCQRNCVNNERWNCHLLHKHLFINYPVRCSFCSALFSSDGLPIHLASSPLCANAKASVVPRYHRELSGAIHQFLEDYKTNKQIGYRHVAAMHPYETCSILAYPHKEKCPTCHRWIFDGRLKIHQRIEHQNNGNVLEINEMNNLIFLF